jgi:prepilin-type N-terminal cleavage/methylation domain-containing protein
MPKHVYRPIVQWILRHRVRLALACCRCFKACLRPSQTVQAKRGFSLIEVAFVLVILSVLFVPIVQNMNRDNELADALLRDVESQNASTETIQDALTNVGKKRYLIEKVGRQLLSRGSQGYFITAHFSEPALILGNTLGTVPKTVFFDQNNAFVLKQYQQTTPSTVYLKSSNNQLVPLFNYAWNLENLSSNTSQQGVSSTAKGYFLVGAKLKLYDVNSLQVSNTLRSVASLQQLAELATNAHLKNTTLLQQAQQEANNNFRMPGKNSVMVNFTLDLSEGSCLAPAMKPYNPRNLLPSWSSLSLMSHDTGNGRLCSPYLAARTGNWNNASRNQDDYDIYNNDGVSQLFWDSNTRVQPQLTSVNGVAIGRVAQSTGEAFPATTNITLLKPNLLPTDNFPEGDFDYASLNAIRCGNRSDVNKYNWIQSSYLQLNYPFITPPQLSCDVTGQSPQFIKVKAFSGNGEFVVEPARMAISAGYSTILHPTQGDLFGTFEPQEYVSGSELARSSTFMSIFEMMRNTDASTQAHISLSVNNHQSGANGNRTGTLMYPTSTTLSTVAALYPAPDGKLAEVMRNLYGVNRMTNTAHLVGKQDFDLVNSINQFNAYRRQRAVINCQQKEPTTTNCYSIDSQYKYRYYSHFFNVVWYMSDGSANLPNGNGAPIASWNSGLLNYNQLRTVLEDNANGAFSTETTTIIVYPKIHAGMGAANSLKARIDGIVQQLKDCGKDVHAYQVNNIAEAEYLIQNTIVPMIDDHIVEEVPAENTFYNVPKDVDSGAYN